MISPGKRSFFYSCLKHDTLNSKSTGLLASNKMKSGVNVGKLEGVKDVKDGVREDYYLLKKNVFLLLFLLLF